LTKIEIFKFNMADGSHWNLKNIIFGNNSIAKFCIKRQNTTVMTTAILKIVMSPHFSEVSSDFDEILFNIAKIMDNK